MTEQQSLGQARLPPARPALHSWGMVADDAEELVADEPDVPVLELVTQESPREEAASMRARVAAGLLALAVCSGEALTLSA